MGTLVSSAITDLEVSAAVGGHIAAHLSGEWKKSTGRYSFMVARYYFFPFLDVYRPLHL